MITLIFNVLSNQSNETIGIHFFHEAHIYLCHCGGRDNGTDLVAHPSR